MQVLALDVGSSSTRACIYDEHGRPVAEGAQRKHAARQRRDGSAELDADELVAEARAVLDATGDVYDALGSSCFWHSLLLLDERDRPLTPVLLWRDQRAAAQAEELAVRLDPEAVHARTGCVLHPSYWPAKLAWLRAEGVLDEARRAVSFADYLFLRLTGELWTSLSTASGSGLLDLRARAWDAELLDALGIDEGLLPPLSDEPAGATYPPLGDGACSNLGAGCVTPDRAALMIGTSGAFRVVRQGEPQPRDGGLFAYFVDEGRVLEGGSVSDGGNLVSWLEANLQLQDWRPREPDGHGITFLPLLGGERSPGWHPRATGAVVGLTFTGDAADVHQAALEGAAYRMAEIAERLPGVREVVATGGALLRNEWWMQVFADVLGLPVTASDVDEASARGAAVHTLERLGIEPEPAPLGRTFQPDAARGEIYASARERQRELYRRLLP
jgi:gluconokinase